MTAKANSDIGLNESDPAYFKQQYPNIAKFLIWPELCSKFKAHEVKATMLKTNSRRGSFTAIVAIVCSLGITLLTTSELMRPFFVGRDLFQDSLAVVALVLLFVALLLGKGILFGRKRDRWLAHRITAERIRQFYFQYLLSSMEAICEGGILEQNAVIDNREAALDKVLRRVDAANYRQLLREDGALQEARLVDLRDAMLPTDGSKRSEEFKGFWEESRFDWQSGYAIGQLDRKASSFSLFGSLADQKATLASLEFGTTLGIIALQCGIVVMQFFVTPDTGSLQISVLLTSFLAVLIVGLQAYEDGLNLNEDFSRNRTYASYTSKLFRDFKEARDQGDGRAQFRTMRELEDLAYFEMQQFLYTKSTARFSL